MLQAGCDWSGQAARCAGDEEGSGVHGDGETIGGMAGFMCYSTAASLPTGVCLCLWVETGSECVSFTWELAPKSLATVGGRRPLAASRRLPKGWNGKNGSGAVIGPILFQAS